MSRKFLVGDPVPYFYCPSSNSKKFNFSSAAGRYIVLCFYGSASIPKNKEVLEFISGKARRFFDDKTVSFFGVSIDRKDESDNRVQQMIPGIRFFWDFDYSVSRQYSALCKEGVSEIGSIEYRPFTLVLDPNMCVVAHIPLNTPEQHNTSLVDVLSQLLPIDQYPGVPITAPILVIPNVFEKGFCQALVKLYEAHGGRESGTMIEKNGYTVGTIDHSFKRRADYIIDAIEIKTMMRQRIMRRVAPQIKKAFQFDVSVVERYIVACYDAEKKGFFKPHRDNTTKGTAHRKFACTINLNAGEYEGGELRFPEFGPKTYSVPTGGALIFSCSLLHEATPVTSGKRYATLPFLYDQYGAKIRRENLKFLSDSEKALGERTAAEAG